MKCRSFVEILGAGVVGTLAGVEASGEAAAPQAQGAGGPVSRSLTIEARPAPITIDTARTAVLVVDMQNDFGAPGGMFARAGIDISMIRAAVAPTARVLASAREAGLPVVYLKMAFRPDLSDAGPVDAPNHARHLLLGFGQPVEAPDGRASRVLVRDTWNTEILPELAPRAGDTVLYKHRFSGFFETELDGILERLGAKYLVVTGCTTSICVESTIRDAMFRDYSCILLADCTGEPIGNDLARTNHDASLLAIETLLGWVSNSHAFTSAARSAV